MKKQLREAAETAFVTGSKWWSKEILSDNAMFDEVNDEWSSAGELSPEDGSYFLLLVAEAI